MKLLKGINKKDYSGVIMLLGAMLPTAFLYLAESCLMIIRKVPLNNVVNGILEMTLIVAAIVVWALVIGSYDEDKCIDRIAYLSQALIKYTLISALSIAVVTFGSNTVLISVYIYYAIILVLVVFDIFAVTSATITLVSKCAKGKQNAKVLRKTLRKKLSLYGVTFAVLVILIALLTFIRINPSYYILQVLLRILQALVVSLYFYFMLNKVGEIRPQAETVSAKGEEEVATDNSQEITTDENVKEESELETDSTEPTEDAEVDSIVEKKKNVNNVIRFIPIVVAGVGLLFSTVILSIINNQNGIEKIMTTLVEEGQFYSDFDDVEEGLKNYILAADYMKMLMATFDDESKTKESIYKSRQNDDYINALYFSGRDERDELEAKMLTGNLSANQRYILLDFYKNKEELSEDEILYQASNVYYCINHNLLVDSDNILGKMHPDKYKVYKAISAVEKKLSYNDALKLVLEIRHNNSISDSELSRILEMAEENPDDIMYQFVALNLSDFVKWEDTGSAKRVANAAIRYADLTKKHTSSPNELLSAYEYALGAITSLNTEWSDDAKRLVDESHKYGKSETINIIELSNIQAVNLGEYENLYEKAGEYLAEDPDNTVYLKYYIEGATGTERIDDALEKMVHMMELFDKADDEEKKEIFTMVTDEIYRMTYYDPRSRYLKKYRVSIDELTDEEKLILSKSPLLEAYFNGLYAVNNYNNYGMSEALDNLNKAASLYPDGKDIYFALGNLYYRCEMYKEAEEQYSKSLDIEDSKNVRYHLAECQFKNGRPKEALRNLEILIKEFNEVGDYQVEWFDIKENTFRLYEEIQEVQ